MIEVRTPVASDIATIGENAAEEWVRARIKSGIDFSALLSHPFAYTGLIGGKPVAAGGFIDQGDDSAIAWSVVGIVPRNMFVSLCREFRRRIAATPYRRIEAHCIATFEESHRWVRCLGFNLIDEKCFTPDGREFRRFVFMNGARHGD